MFYDMNYVKKDTIEKENEIADTVFKCKVASKDSFKRTEK